MTDNTEKTMIRKIEEMMRTGKDIQPLVSELLNSCFRELLSEVTSK